MRQAGRALPEYRAVRKEGSILQAIRTPDLAAEITLQPVRRYGVDAAVLFSDIIVPVAAVGFGVDIKAGIGPLTERPFAQESDLQRLRPLQPDEDLPWVAETVRILVGELRVPLIGFAGGPFTLASYLIEGRPTRDFARTKSMMQGDTALWHRLLGRLADLAIASLRDQIQAGASAVQVFDSWIGALTPEEYELYVMPHARSIFDGIADLHVPRIHFGVGTSELLGLMAQTGPEVLGVDWRVSLREAATRAPGVAALQGNLNPETCLLPWESVEDEARRILAERPADVGHIFNLGHGVLPETDPGILSRLVDLVHDTTSVESA